MMYPSSFFWLSMNGDKVSWKVLNFFLINHESTFRIDLISYHYKSLCFFSCFWFLATTCGFCKIQAFNAQHFLNFIILENYQYHLASIRIRNWNFLNFEQGDKILRMAAEEAVIFQMLSKSWPKSYLIYFSYFFSKLKFELGVMTSLFTLKICDNTVLVIWELSDKYRLWTSFADSNGYFQSLLVSVIE